jgi:serine/threonine-protein kinase
MLGYVAQSLMYQERNVEAEKLFLKVLAATEQIYGKTHQKVALALVGLSSVHLRLGQSTAAIAENSRALDIYRSTFGEEHEYTVIALANLATVYLEARQYAKAETLTRKAVMLFSKIQSPTHMNTGIARMKLGRALLGQRKYREAEEETRTSYEILTRLTAPTNGFIQADRSDLVKEYNALGERQKAAHYRLELAANEQR